MTYDKADVARRQLGAALQLFIDDRDPVSVHCLACGGSEIAEHLVAKTEQPSFATHILETFPDMHIGDVRRLQRQYWNAFKHALGRNDREREDEELLARFDDEKNDHALFIGWYDLGQALGRMPIEAQVYQVWYFAKHPDKVREGVELEPFLRIFPDINSLPRNKQKERLRRVIVRTRQNREVMGDTRTDRRSLILKGS